MDNASISPQQINTSITTFDNLNIVEAADYIEQCSLQDSYAFVVTPNMDHLTRLCEKDTHFSAVYDHASLTLCDSRIVGKLLLLAGKPVKAIVPGSDLTQYLFNSEVTSEKKLLVFGASEASVQQLQQQYSHLNISHINPSMGFINKPEEVKALIEQVKSVEADYIFLAVGSPRQEIFAYQLKQAGLKKGVALCIGASINFIIGDERRAPELLQKLHLEWFYRMLQDPRRLVKRYSKNALYLPKVFFALKKSNQP